MDAKQTYDSWTLETHNKKNSSGNLEEKALQTALAEVTFDYCLEIGCGTGKNTAWLIEKAKHVTAVDYSSKLLARAKKKVKTKQVQFIQADITNKWTFREELYDLVSMSLVLEHIENLDHIFREVSKSLCFGGYAYIGEFHPFKNYAYINTDSDAEKEQNKAFCFKHTLSDFVQVAKKYGFMVVDIEEYFEDEDKSGIPRILTMLLKKNDTTNLLRINKEVLKRIL